MQELLTKKELFFFLFLRKHPNNQLEKHRLRFDEENVSDFQPTRSSSVCYFPEAIIIPGSQQYKIHIVMHELTLFGLSRNHLQATSLVFDSELPISHLQAVVIQFMSCLYHF